MNTRNPEVEKLLDQLNITKDTQILGDGGLIKELTKRLLERALEGEMTAHLGYEKGERGSELRSNPRNGSSTKRVKTGNSELEIEVPRDRDGTFEPVIVKKHQGRLDGFNDTVISLYARGMSTRDIRGHLEELYGVEVSPELISKVTDAVLQDVGAWRTRSLEAIWVRLLCDDAHDTRLRWRLGRLGPEFAAASSGARPLA